MSERWTTQRRMGLCRLFCESELIATGIPHAVERLATLLNQRDELLNAAKAALQFVVAAVQENVALEGFDAREHVVAKQLTAAIAATEKT